MIPRLRYQSQSHWCLYQSLLTCINTKQVGDSKWVCICETGIAFSNSTVRTRSQSPVPLKHIWLSELSSGLYGRVEGLATDVSEVRTASNIREPWWWRKHVPLKRRSTITLHGNTSQKTNSELSIFVPKKYGDFLWSVWASVWKIATRNNYMMLETILICWW
jgi:hypothetical protein